MSRQFVASIRRFAAAMALASFTAVGAGGQTQPGGGGAKPGAAAPRTPAPAPAATSDAGIKRLPDGQPNMQGIYVPNWPSTVPIERLIPEERKAHAELLIRMRGANTGAGPGGPDIETDLQGPPPPPGTVMVVDPPDGRIPYQPWAA